MKSAEDHLRDALSRIKKLEEEKATLYQGTKRLEAALRAVEKRAKRAQDAAHQNANDIAAIKRRLGKGA